MDPDLIRLYGGRTKESHRVIFEPTETSKSYTYPTISDEAVIFIEPTASMPHVLSRSGRSITIGKMATPDVETIRFLVMLPDQELE